MADEKIDYQLLDDYEDDKIINQKRLDAKLYKCERLAHRKYLKYCERWEIPYPILPDYHAEHMTKCQNCQRIWPLFVYQHHFENGIPLHQVSTTWEGMPESRRIQCEKGLIREQRKWLRTMSKTRVKSGFFLFLESHREGVTQANLPQETVKASNVWTNKLTEEEREVYKAESRKLVELNAQKISSLPRFKREILAIHKKSVKLKKKANHIKKPDNMWLMYLKSRWSAVKDTTQLHYKEIMAIASKEWKAMDENAKKPYKKLYNKACEQYNKKIEETKRLKQDAKEVRKVRKVIVEPKE